MIDRLSRCLLLIGGAIAIAGCATPASTPSSASGLPQAAQTAAYSAADEAEYIRRFDEMMENARSGDILASYEPVEPVIGATNPSAIPLASAPTLSKDARTAAIEYAQAANSSAFLIWKDGALEAERYFGETRRDTPIVSKSLAKPVSVLLVGRAMAQGYIASLDQPAADFLTEWQDDPQRSKITIRNLLQMHSGLLPQSFSPERDDILNRAYLHPRHDEVIINDYPITDEPGTRYEYSNANAELIAPLIERATGQRYAAYLGQELLQPIGAAGGTVWVNRPGGMAHSGCCLLLPAQSWLRLGMLVLGDGVWDGERLLPDGFVEEMRAPSRGNPHYGMGLWLAEPYVEKRGFSHPSIAFGKVHHSAPYADPDIALFDGNGNQVVYLIPSQNMVVLRTGSAPPKDKPFDNAYLPNLLIADALDTARP